MDEKRIEQVLDIENQAQQIHDAALSEAEQLPKQAERDAQALLDKSRADAEAEAREILAKSQNKDESEHILAQTKEKSRNNEVVATTNFDRAVAYVVNRVIGKE